MRAESKEAPASTTSPARADVDRGFAGASRHGKTIPPAGLWLVPAALSALLLFGSWSPAVQSALVLAILACLALAFWRLRRAARPAAGAADLLARAALAGDYSLRAESGVPLADALNQLLTRLESEAAARAAQNQAAEAQAGTLVELRVKADEYQRNETFLQSILEHLPVMVFIKDAKELRYVMWNRHNEELLGISRAEALGRNDYDFFPREQADFFTARDRETLAGDKLVEVEEEIQTRQRGRRILRTRKIPIRDAAGQALYLLGISEEITDQKAAHAELTAERELLRSLLDNSPDHIYFKDRQSRFLKCSKVTYERLALPELEIIGKTDFDLFDEAHARPAFEDEQRIIQTGQPMLGKVEREVWKDGHESWALTSKMPLRNRAGDIIGTFGISKNITAIKVAEAQLAAAHQKLVETSRRAGMAEVATSVLHNVGNVLNSVNVSAGLIHDQLKASRLAGLGKVVRLLREHENDLGRFLSQDAKGRQLPAYLDQLAQQLAREQAQLLAETAALAANVDHIKDIVATQQSYARISGVSELVRASDLAEDALRMHLSSLNRHAVECSREYDPDLPPIPLERHKTLQILVNLIKNAKQACEASDRKDKRLRIRVANAPSGIRISVVDNGVGIAPENLTRIFNHGFTTKKDGHGFGLHGSALAARELGGTLTAESEGSGRGATFTLELPLAGQSPVPSALAVAAT